MRSRQLDVLVFPEIGMDVHTYILALARAAPVQVATHGNSVSPARVKAMANRVSHGCTSL